MPDPTTVVIAPNYSRFVGWCHNHGLNPRSKALLYVSPDDLSRIRGVVLRRDIDRVVNLTGDPEASAIVATRYRR